MQKSGSDGSGPALGAGQHGQSEFDSAEFGCQLGQDAAHPVQGFGLGNDE
ncbi:hypothetical protein EES43_17720 [Streptomyces sp. ADI96-02]|nr:hypothetical protein EES43_17720 [Streptomyces sp. ADI96-02]